jgi:hypothetical protein
MYVVLWVLTAQDEDKARWWYYYQAGCYKLASLLGEQGMHAELQYKKYVM